MGATTLLLLDIEIEDGRDVVRRLRSLARSELLPDRARHQLTAAADSAATALLVGAVHLEALRDDHPAEAQVAGRLSAELEQEAEVLSPQERRAWSRDQAVRGRLAAVDGASIRCGCGHHAGGHEATPFMPCLVEGCDCDGFDPALPGGGS